MRIGRLLGFGPCAFTVCPNAGHAASSSAITKATAAGNYMFAARLLPQKIPHQRATHEVKEAFKARNPRSSYGWLTTDN